MRGLHITCGCLDLRLLGIRHGSGAAEFLESARFAFGRAVVLALVAGSLFRAAGKCSREL
jgi:hypothetical protein